MKILYYPSGTALLLADAMKDSIEDKTEYVYGRQGHGKRKEKRDGNWKGNGLR